MGVSRRSPDERDVIRGTNPDKDPMRPMGLAWETYSDMALADWYRLLSQDPEEDEIQRFLELHPSMIPGGSGDIGPGGHHGSDMGAVFRRPKLIGGGRAFEPDFMWVTHSSALVTPILIEIEKPSKRWFRKDGRPTSEFTEARDQLNDWRSWFAREGNKALFRDTFLFLDDKCEDRPLEPQYVLIYGRESEFRLGGGHVNPSELRYKRDQQRARDEFFMTFDALRPRFDHRNSMTLTMTAYGPEVHAFSPVFGTGASIGEGALVLGDPQAALARSVMMTNERRAYLARRWAFWQEDERQKNAAPDGIYFRSLEIE
ncbi:Shedu anti-phage system protein SduA domain-containing protein [Streptomyces sp. NPDC002132]|uniref:Shedu anti-phage system protein SduA domain-containing protein n=1 Tax=unclassified Streptomyces TaxID=2593676 RepID=UPI00332109B4